MACQAEGVGQQARIPGWPSKPRPQLLQLRFKLEGWPVPGSQRPLPPTAPASELSAQPPGPAPPPPRSRLRWPLPGSREQWAPLRRAGKGEICRSRQTATLARRGEKAACPRWLRPSPGSGREPAKALSQRVWGSFVPPWAEEPPELGRWEAGLPGPQGAHRAGWVALSQTGCGQLRFLAVAAT